MGIKCTPNAMILWVSNIILKGIAELSDFSLDLDGRKVYVLATLYGETEPIEAWLDGFSVISDEGTHYLVLQEGRSNRAWLNTIFSRVVGKTWRIPELPQYQSYIDLIAELLRAERPEQEDEDID